MTARLFFKISPGHHTFRPGPTQRHPTSLSVSGLKLGWYNVAAMSKPSVENSQRIVHGTALCWTARISSSGLSVFAVAYLLSHEAEYPVHWWYSVPVAVWVSTFTIAPSLIAWWPHRFGGASVLVTCLVYTVIAYELASRAAFFHAVVPFSSIWAASCILHLIVSWKEERSSQIPG